MDALSRSLRPHGTVEPQTKQPVYDGDRAEREAGFS